MLPPPEAPELDPPLLDDEPDPGTPTRPMQVDPPELDEPEDPDPPPSSALVPVQDARAVLPLPSLAHTWAPVAPFEHAHASEVGRRRRIPGAGTVGDVLHPKRKNVHIQTIRMHSTVISQAWAVGAYPARQL